MSDENIMQNPADENVNQIEEMETDENTIEVPKTESSPQVHVQRKATLPLHIPLMPPLEANVYKFSWTNKSVSHANKQDTSSTNWWDLSNRPDTGNSGNAGNGNTSSGTAKLRFKDCGGLGKQISFITTSVLGPLTAKNADQYKRFGLEPPKGILFYGAPGTGKTRLAQALSTEISEVIGHPVHFIYRKGNDIASKYFGESSENLRQVFAEARQKKPSVLFFDELDGLCPSRDKPYLGEAYITIVTTMLGLMDELKRGEVFVIGATNRMDDIDPALRRPGRFDKYLEFLPPTEQGRREILTIHTNTWKSKPSAGQLVKLSQETTGFSGADLAKLCLDAFDQALNREIRSEKERRHLFTYASARLDNLAVTDNDWKLAMSKMKPSTMGVFGSTQYFPQDKAEIAEKVQPLIQENFQGLKGLITKLLPKQAEVKTTNGNPSHGVVQALYIWSQSESCLSTLDDFIIAPLFGPLGGEEMNGYAKYTLSSEILYSTQAQNWPKKVNNAFSQAIASHLPSILYIPDMQDLCDVISSYHLTEAINLKHQLERLRDTHVLLVVAGTTCPEEFSWNNPFGSVLTTQTRAFQIQRPTHAERTKFFSKIADEGKLFATWSEEKKMAFRGFLQRIVRSTEDEELGSIVTLYDSIQHELASAVIAENNHVDDILKSLFDLAASYDMNRALINSSIEPEGNSVEHDNNDNMADD